MPIYMFVIDVDKCMVENWWFMFYVKIYLFIDLWKDLHDIDKWLKFLCEIKKEIIIF